MAEKRTRRRFTAEFKAEAARRAGMGRQALRDAVLCYNAEGPDGLHDWPRSGRPERLTAGRQAALKARVLRGPDPERDGVSAWRLVDVCAHAEEAYGVRYSGWGMSCLLRRLGLSRQKARPRHSEGSAAERAAFEKWTWVEARRDRESPPGREGAALVRGRGPDRPEGSGLPPLIPARRAPAGARRQAVREPLPVAAREHPQVGSRTEPVSGSH
jgi:transposase